MEQDNLRIFSFDSFQVRVVLIGGLPWFVAKDICDVLEHTNQTVAIDGLDIDERSKVSLGRQGDANIINESGLYALIIRSNKPEAKKFRKWLTSEVLPSIRNAMFFTNTPDGKSAIDSTKIRKIPPNVVTKSSSSSKLKNTTFIRVTEEVMSNG